MNLLLAFTFLFAQAAPAPSGAAPENPPDANAAAPANPADSPPAADGADNASDTSASAGSDEELTPGTRSFKDVLGDIATSGAMGLMIRGGYFMWPILILGIVALGVLIERYRSLKMLGADSTQVREHVRQLLHQDRVEEALEFCDRQQGPVPAILSAGLRKYLVLRRLNYDPGKIEEQVVKAMDDYSVHVVAALEKHLPILATVSSAAPMVGFLGTVSGMINSFDAIVATLGEQNIVEAAAAGIGEALLTTCFGLIVGIPAYVGFNYYTSVINDFVLDVEESATDLIEAVTLQMAIERHEVADAQVDGNHKPLSTSYADEVR